MRPKPPSERKSSPKPKPKPESKIRKSASRLPEDAMFPIIPPSGNAPYLETESPAVEASEDEYPHENENDEAKVNRFISGEDLFSVGFEVSESDTKSLCDSCKHSWSMRKRAEVQNVDVGGDVFMAKEGYCTAINHSLFSLNDRFIYECNLFELGERPRVRRKDDESE
jgi:hypothetical protein